MSGAPLPHQEAIDVKLCVERFVKSIAICAELCIENYAKRDTEQAQLMINLFKSLRDKIYSRDKDVNYYRTVEDDVVEVLMEEQLKNWYSTYTNYIDTFVRASNVKSMKIRVCLLL